MIPILYGKNERDFSTGGIGYLSEAAKVTVTEERNGGFELSMQYPVTGMWYGRIEKGAIVKAKANETADPQLFRIYKASKPLKGIVTYSAEHISYDLCGIPLLGFSIRNATAADAINRAITEAPLPCDFTATSDISTLHSTAISTPCSVRALLGGQTGSILDVWGGEYEFDNFTVRLHAHRGEDRGVTVEYGKNLTDIKQEENISECYTHLLPYAVIQEEDGAERCIFLSEKLLPLPGAENLGHHKACIMDLSDRFSEEEPVNEETLREKAAAYAADASLAAPKVNITVSFVQLWQTEEYKKIAPLERVRLCDTVTVRFPRLGIDAKTKVIKTVYDALKEKYDSITLGDAKSTLADRASRADADLQGVRRQVQSGQSRAAAELKKAVERATSLITGHSGGYVVLHPAEMPQEILILDHPSIEEAVNVWRWNGGGLGHSSTGWNGKYTTAITADGQIVADFITAGKLSGALIEAGTLEADTVRTAWNGISEYIDMANGELNIYNSPGKQPGDRILRLDKNGTSFYTGGNSTGWIGANSWAKDASQRGIVLQLDEKGKFLAWGVKEDASAEVYTMVLYYTKAGAIGQDEEKMNLGAPLDCHNFAIENANLKSVAVNGKKGWTGEIPIITSIERTGDGGITWRYSTITVEDGIITSAPRSNS